MNRSPSPGAARPTPSAVLLALAVLAAGAGCPIPQPLPDYQRGTTTAARIVMDGIVHRETIIRVPAGCATEPTYALAGVQLNDPNTSEAVIARWFVDYDQDSERLRLVVHEDTVQPPPSDTKDPLLRIVPSWTYRAYSFDDVVGAEREPSAEGVLHVVELVVSADFDDALAPVNRAPATGFETQTYRWVFMNVSPTAAVKCPGT